MSTLEDAPARETLRSSVRMLLVLSVSTGAVGCDRVPRGEDAPDPGSHVSEASFTVHDSAGVEIVVNHAPERPRGQFWTLDPNPVVVLGGGSGLTAATGRTDARDTVTGAIWRVSGMARLVDGRVAVLSSENRQLYLFEPSGALSRTIGRRGRGPGEFSRPQHLWYLPPDTLVVWDQWMGAVTRFDTAGRVLERRTIDLGRALAELPDQANPESRTLPVPDGSFIAHVQLRDTGRVRPRDYELVRHHPEEYVRLDKEYVAISFGTWGGPEHWTVPEEFGKAAPISHYQPFNMPSLHLKIAAAVFCGADSWPRGRSCRRPGQRRGERATDAGALQSLPARPGKARATRAATFCRPATATSPP